jgi:hypothetical protein
MRCDRRIDGVPSATLGCATSTAPAPPGWSLRSLRLRPSGNARSLPRMRRAARREQIIGNLNPVRCAPARVLAQRPQGIGGRAVGRVRREARGHAQRVRQILYSKAERHRVDASRTSWLGRCLRGPRLPAVCRNRIQSGGPNPTSSRGENDTWKTKPFGGRASQTRAGHAYFQSRAKWNSRFDADQPRNA